MKNKNHNIRFNMEKEDAFAERIVETVEKKVMSNLPALFGMYMAQMQFFPFSAVWCTACKPMPSLGRLEERNTLFCSAFPHHSCFPRTTAALEKILASPLCNFIIN